ncbi:hypothetical protein ABRP55_23180, partial [Pectobacterium zantedeschiae]|uniref:hypothetical protein n=1 Tax=Pectobacterium zantedeschiae TaxID=2034769 RepID=UPI0032ED71D3
MTTTDPSVVVSGSAVLVACDALESYQINSGCSNIRIFNNKSDGTGDSNVVIGADYHYNGSEWELSPSDVVLSDFPTDNIIAFNELSNAIHSNIAINNSNKGLMISNNTLSHAGFNYDNSLVLDCNINCSFFSIITNNDIFVDAGVIRPRSAIASVA